MILWIIIAVVWIAVLAAGIFLYKVATFTERKVKNMSARVRRDERRAA
ncbi:MAG TPA: hypothetical protein VI685_11470 [Candidatus Angelobacter sp.]